MLALEKLLTDDCGKLAHCDDGCCMACLHCIGARVANLMSLFGDDWLGALCCLSGHANAVSDCARGLCGHSEYHDIYAVSVEDVR